MTKHTTACTMAFGKARPETGCPRCIELAQGAKPRTWTKSNDTLRCEEIRAHFASDKHRSGGCGPVCTFGEW